MAIRLALGVAVLAASTAAAVSSAAAVPRVYTAAGNGLSGFSGDRGLALDARIRPECIAVAADGSLLIGGGARVRRVGRDGRITTVAGTGRRGFSGDGGPATRARISGCSYEDENGGLAALPDGGFVLAEGDSNRLRRVGPDGVIRTIAGDGGSGILGDGGPALQAQLSSPTRPVALADGSIAVTTAGLLRRIAPDGRIETLAGVGSACGRAAGQDGSAFLLRPAAIAPVADGGFLLRDEYVAGNDAGCVLRVAADGRITMPPQGYPSPLWPSAVAPTSDGGFLVAGSGEVRHVAPNGTATTVAGCHGEACAQGEGPALSVALVGIQSVAPAPDGGFHLALATRIVRVDADGMLTTFAPISGPSLARSADGSLLLVRVEPGSSGWPPTRDELDTVPTSLVRIAADGSTTAVAAGGGSDEPQPGRQATAVALHPAQVQALPDGFAVFDAERQIVVTVDGSGTITRVVGVGRPGAEWEGGDAVSTDVFAILADGSLVAVRRFVDANGLTAWRVDRLGADGGWRTIAGGPRAAVPGIAPLGIALLPGAAPGPGGSLLIRDAEGLVRVGPAGVITGVRRSRLVSMADAFAPGPRGTALVAWNGSVYRVRDTGEATRLAGGGRAGFFGTTEGERATRADFDWFDVLDVAAARDGGVFIALQGWRSTRPGLARVLWIAPSRTKRLGLAITRRSLGLLRTRQIAVRSTVPARIVLVARQRGRVAGRVRGRVRAGESVVRLPRGVGAGEFSLTARARTSGGQRASSRHRFLLGSTLPLATARRLAGAERGDCRRVTRARVDCIVEEVLEGSMEDVESCTLSAIFLKASGVIYRREGTDADETCSAGVKAGLWNATHRWGDAREAPPL